MKKVHLKKSELGYVKAIGAGLLLLAAGAAKAVPIIGNETTVELTSFDTLVGVGLTPGVLGTATIDTSGTFPILTFPITGGEQDDITDQLLIEHDGSGISLTGPTADPADGDATATVDLENFLISTEDALLTGLVSVDGSQFGADVPLFDIDLTTLTLSLDEVAAGALTTVFGLPDLAGTEIGVASLDLEFEQGPPTTVAEPDVVYLLAPGLLLIGLAKVRAQRRRPRRTFALQD